ncbi:Hypothetical predicted protein [Pelobates cultripes]|uniref:Uncharacterized protein n=1 Tax=Pelobates cultripes TaxID=61616 RepID=A0AAD1R5U9_PELCU|nr:Hypothetical predicted protein [Pelobates cultripes]
MNRGGVGMNMSGRCGWLSQPRCLGGCSIGAQCRGGEVGVCHTRWERLQLHQQASPISHLELIPASKAETQNLLTELKALFVTDITLVWEDMGAITVRLQVLEYDSDITTGNQDDLRAGIDKLKRTNLTMEDSK